jgi:hypothetical protein
MCERTFLTQLVFALIGRLLSVQTDIFESSTIEKEHAKKATYIKPPLISPLTNEPPTRSQKEVAAPVK